MDFFSALFAVMLGGIFGVCLAESLFWELFHPESNVEDEEEREHINIVV